MYVPRKSSFALRRLPCSDCVACECAELLSKRKNDMKTQAASENSIVESDPRVPLAFERTLLAYERTQIAWVRTALALISFGFAIAKFFQYLRQQQGETAALMSPRMVGLLMILIGLVGLILANIQQRRAVKALRRRCPQLPKPAAGIMAMMIAFLGVLALIGALVR